MTAPKRYRKKVEVQFGPQNRREGLEAMALVVVGCVLASSPVWLIVALYELGVGK